MSRTSSSVESDSEVEEESNEVIAPDEKEKTAEEDAAQNEEDEKKKAEEEEAKAKLLKVRKVNACQKFFCSIRVIVILVLVAFCIILCGAVGVTFMLEVQRWYQEMDVLRVKERIQNAIAGVFTAESGLFTRGGVLVGDLCGMGTDYYNQPAPSSDNPDNVEAFEEYLAKRIALHEDSVVEGIVLGTGLSMYEGLPLQLIMAWDENATMRLAYYIPCQENSKSICTIPDEKEERVKILFADPDNDDYTLLNKDKIPGVFWNLDPTHRCPTMTEYSQNPDEKCGGLVDIPWSEGGPMMFVMWNGVDYASLSGVPDYTYTFANWTWLIAAHSLILNKALASRTGLCSSVYSSTEKGLPSEVTQAIDDKSASDIINPFNFVIDQFTGVTTYGVKTDEAALDQTYYLNDKKDYNEPANAICDDYYDHGDGDSYVSKTTVFLSYTTFDNNTYKHSRKNTILFRFDYHNPLTREHFRIAGIGEVVFCVAWLLTMVGVFIYFHFVFLVPLDRMRKMRAELIKETLSSLEYDGLIAKDVFGDMTDDTALLEANGDEITVMLTLQARIDAIYTNLINGKAGELAHARTTLRNELCALRIMNLFLRREDDALRAILPGLMDPNEIARRYRRTTLVAHSPEGELINELSNAKRSFRTLKAVFGNSLAVQFFKAYCIQRGRSSINSFFFLMDVGGLHQLESGSRSEDDFLAGMFADSVSPSPSLSPRSPFSMNRSEEGMNLGGSSDFLCSPETSAVDLQLGRAEPDRPRHSHFAKKADSTGTATSTGSTGSGNLSPTSSPAPVQLKAEEEDTKKAKTPKLPIGKAGAPAGPTSPKAANVPQFSNARNSEIARFIHESYFGPRSLAQRDMRHAALLGCSQVPDYLTLRDKDNVVFSPVMFDNLVTAVTKKFTAEVLPQFLNSVSFQVLVYALRVTGFFESQEHHQEGQDKEKEKDKPEEKKVDVGPVFKDDSLLKSMWQACHNPEEDQKKKKRGDSEDDESTTSSSTSDESDSDDESDEESDEESEKEKSEEEDEKPAQEEKPKQPEKDDKPEEKPKQSEKEVKPEEKPKQPVKDEEDESSSSSSSPTPSTSSSSESSETSESDSSDESSDDE